MTRPNPKYKLTDQTIVVGKRKLFRIRALRDFYSFSFEVKFGQLGGFVGSENNLSHEDSCWISGEARVQGDAWVYGSSWVKGRACVKGNANVGGQAVVGGHAKVGGDAWVGRKASLDGKARVDGHAAVGGIARVGGNASLAGDVLVEGNIHITTGHFTSGNFFEQPQIDAYLADLKTKEQNYAQA